MQLSGQRFHCSPHDDSYNPLFSQVSSMGITPFFVENVSELQLCAIKLVTAVSLFLSLCCRFFYTLTCVFHPYMRFWFSTQLKLETDHLYCFLSPGFLALWEASAADLGGDLYVFSQTAHQQTLSQEFQVICSWIQIAVQIYSIKWGAWLMSGHQCNKIIVEAELKILWCKTVFSWMIPIKVIYY